MAGSRYGLLGLLSLLAVMLVGLQVRLWTGEGGRRAVDELQDRVAELIRENGGLQQRNDALAAEVHDLKSGEAAVEERARSELGMIRPGEVFYRVVEHDLRPAPPSAEPADDAEQAP